MPASGPGHKHRRVGIFDHFRRPGLLLLPLILALAARVLVAPGWMIESDASGSITVRICSDPTDPMATQTIAIKKASDHPAAGQSHCPWGALAAAPLVPDFPVLPEKIGGVEPTPSAAPSLGFAPGIASPLPPSTGPPSLT